MSIERWDAAAGPPTEAAMCANLTARGYRCTVYVYPPGTRFPDHAHDVDKIDGVLSGQFRIVMDGKTFLLGAGDLLAVPRGCVHSAEVVGDVPVVSVDAAR
jgi:mannose-6-phosphate isomerase-like protein (cupin superfamily)